MCPAEAPGSGTMVRGAVSTGSLARPAVSRGTRLTLGPLAEPKEASGRLSAESQIEPWFALREPNACKRPVGSRVEARQLMQRKTAKQTTKRRIDSSPMQSGLIAKGKNAERSATTKCVLDNRSHRTTLQISCERKPTSGKKRSEFCDLTMRTIRLFPQRSTTSFA